MTQLAASDLSGSIQKTRLFHDVSLTLRPGRLTSLIGPNGAGKSSLLKVLCGLNKADTGKVTIDDQPLSDLSDTERARLISYLPQSRQLAWPISVENAVALGRFAYGGMPSKLSDADAEAVNHALHICELTDLRHRRTDTLSGGELSRMHFARAFAGRTSILIADEPLAALDPKHQLRVMKLIRDFTNNGGTALVVLHDIQLAAQFSDELLWMHEGRIVASGAPSETLTPENMKHVFDVTATIENGKLIAVED